MTTDRVETLSRRFMAVLYVYGRTVDREPTCDADGDPIDVPIPQGLTDDALDALPPPPAEFVALVEGAVGVLGRGATGAFAARARRAVGA